MVRPVGHQAFAELVRRHGPVVLAACRRVLGPGQDADDAFQAAFLVLARRAGAVRDTRVFGAWLHGVARHVALRQRDRERRRRKHEARAAPLARGPADPGSHAVVDDELARLPDRLRLPVIACVLEERSQEEVARALGVSLSTVRRRLDGGWRSSAGGWAGGR
ncbi:sigma-70 family RNA polymerase sigma factor [bacterium]|nr:sigma-70 family RNA polymerase sigma factor [bacterium]